MTRLAAVEKGSRLGDDLHAVEKIECALARLRDEFAHDHALALPGTRHDAPHDMQRRHRTDQLRCFLAGAREQFEAFRTRVNRVECGRTLRKNQAFARAASTWPGGA